MKSPLAAIAVGFTLLMGATSASAVPLYDGSLGQTADLQGWSYLGTISPPALSSTTNALSLDTDDISNYGGYFRLAPFQLDRTPGYTISFSLKIDPENLSNNNYVSLIVMSDALPGETQPYGIELNFGENSIWAQNKNFTAGEKVAVKGTAATKSYVLKVQGNQYQLLTSNLAPPILQGSLRKYPGFTPIPGFINPYTTPNMIFIGDKTPLATSKVAFTRVSASPLN
jgi:hypothetical protein